VIPDKQQEGKHMSIPTNKPPKHKRSHTENAVASSKPQQDSSPGESRQQSSVQREQFSPRATDNHRGQEEGGQKKLFRS
jgi:hypothetical protein